MSRSFVWREINFDCPCMAFRVIHGTAPLWSLSADSGHCPGLARDGSVPNDPKPTYAYTGLFCPSVANFNSCDGPFWDYIHWQSRAAQAPEISTPERHPARRLLPVEFKGAHHAHIRPLFQNHAARFLRNRAAHFPYLPDLRQGNEANRHQSKLRRRDLRLRVQQRWDRLSWRPHHFKNPLAA
jgi:hypothetical protein